MAATSTAPTSPSPAPSIVAAAAAFYPTWIAWYLYRESLRRFELAEADDRGTSVTLIAPPASGVAPPGSSAPSTPRPP